MDYKNGKIYTLRSHQTDDIYIGSTASTLAKRLYTHKTDYKSYLNGKRRFITSFEILKFDDAYIELLEDYPCENKNELCKREGELIRQNNCVNKRVEGRTQQDYYRDNLDKIKECRKEYREQNKDKIKQIHKEYREQNKDKLKETKKDYYQKNKEKFNEKVICECGSCYTFIHKSRHLKSQKHLNYIKTT